MYNSQNIAERIKDRAKQKNVSVNQLLLNCNLGKNTVTKISSGTDILTLNFAKIADYLDCSVDYLLGRCDTPQIQNSELDDTESEVIKNLRQLNGEGKENILDYSNYIVDSGRYKTEIASEFSPTAKLVAYGGKNIAPTRKKPKGTF